MLSLHQAHSRKRTLIWLLAGFFVLFTPKWAEAASKGISYRATVGRDLDGDHIPETATVHQNRSVYQVNIHFTSGRPRLKLTVYRPEGEAGLSFEASDIDNDHNTDLVITSATSLQPLAVWLNRGKAKFQKVRSWPFGRFGNYNGPSLNHHRITNQPCPAVSSSTDLFAHPVNIDHLSNIGPDAQHAAYSDPEQRPSDFILQQVFPRGPPLHIAL
ncbi:MAG TPA: VCBS repeat-containing protein [Terriglobia bacterium]|nr:VCBS repeat-containing protein [Terriglobia bacterium]